MHTNSMEMLSNKRILASLSLWLMCCGHLSEGLVVPNEIATVLGQISSRIPLLKKGTDSRIGFGYRVGPNADFQLTFDIGPQKETQPLGGDMDSGNTYYKRQVNKKDQKNLWNELTTTERTAANWLENWSNNLRANDKKRIKQKQKQNRKQNRKTSKQTKKQDFVLPTMPSLPEASLKQLQLLYKLASHTTMPKASVNEKESIKLTPSNVLTDSEGIIEPRGGSKLAITSEDEIKKNLMNN